MWIFIYNVSFSVSPLHRQQKLKSDLQWASAWQWYPISRPARTCDVSTCDVSTWDVSTCDVSTCNGSAWDVSECNGSAWDVSTCDVSTYVVSTYDVSTCTICRIWINAKW